MTHLWRVELLGRLRARQGHRTITRFRTRKTGVLLAYLALHRHSSHPREQLLELLWPDSDADAGRHSLSQALSSLRHQLEPPGVPGGSLIIADRFTVQLNPEACSVDVLELNARLAAARRCDGAERLACQLEALELYQGPLLPGFYDDWVVMERETLSQAYLRIVCQVIDALEQAGDLERAIVYASRAVAIEPLLEDVHRTLMQLYALVGQPAAALRQYATLRKILKEELGEAPTAATSDLAGQIEGRVAAVRAVRRERHGAPGPVESAAGRAGDIAPGPGERSLPRDVHGAFPTALTGDGPGERSLPRDEHGSFPTASLVGEEPAPTGSLPLSHTRLIGRAQELEQLYALLEAGADRLITLTGPGGTGKTRLALALARRLLEPLGGKVCFVPLADVSDPAQLGGAVLEAMQLTPASGVDPMRQLGRHLARDRWLLVLDNLEHLIDAGAAFVAGLLELAPRLACLVTSRQRMDLAAERVFPVAPLPVPPEAATPERLCQNESVQLFVERAQSVRPDFQVTAANAGAISALCRCLEGIPLALELAAARVQVLTPAQMRARLQDRFGMLVSRRRDLPARHRALRATLDWSYQLLSPALRRCFARLSVFRGGWTLEAAEAVTGAGAADLLAQLCECSLILAEGDGDIRFRMLETLREYAAEQLEAEERAALAPRHARHYLELAMTAQPGLAGPDQGRWLDRLGVELENFRTALAWSVRPEGDASLGLQLSLALLRFWQLRGQPREGREVLLEALERLEGRIDPAEQARALGAAGLLAHGEADFTAAAALHRRALTLFQALEDPTWVARTLNNLGNAAKELGDLEEAFRAYEQSLGMMRQLDDPAGVGKTLNNLGNIAMHRGDPAGAERLYRESLGIKRALGDLPGVASTLTNLGNAAMHAGAFETARRYHEDSLALVRSLGHDRAIAGQLNNLGNLALYQGDLDTARRLHGEALGIQQALGERGGASSSLCSLGLVAWHQGAPLEARARFRQSLEILRQVGGKAGIAECLEGLAMVYVTTGAIPRAARLFGAAEALREAIGTPMIAAERPAYERMRHQARDTLGEAAFARLARHGARLELETAMALELETEMALELEGATALELDDPGASRDTDFFQSPLDL